ncbi:MAG: YbjN domain-containing protein [Microscillaceae bacterium]|nr:YbjN domain-containing protein [Microscillaceae bacterium]MDW8460006.1 YbjN domain-containing protein [Cytophagales bacterium]
MTEVHKEDVYRMIAQFVKSVGLDPREVFHPEDQVWHWQYNDHDIQVFVETIYFKEGYVREYLRIFSPLLALPQPYEVNLMELLRYLLELNDVKLGVKISIMPRTDWVYATYERDIRGMDYQELVTCLSDLAWWAEQLTQEIENRIAEMR